MINLCVWVSVLRVSGEWLSHYLRVYNKERNGPRIFATLCTHVKINTSCVGHGDCVIINTLVLRVYYLSCFCIYVVSLMQGILSFGFKAAKN